MKVVVVGAGPSGLITAKALLDAGMDFDVFEGTDSVGGTWVYSDGIVDKHGLPLHSSSYKNLKTYLPKELMLFNGLDHDVEGASFITGKQVQHYLEKFAKKFNFMSKIQFEHFIRRISRKSDSWEVIVKNLNTGVETTLYYDAVLICTGHYSIPFYRNIIGSDSFPGSAIHSRDYRVPEQYKNKVVLITGIGPSAIDIVYDIAPHSKLIYLSHNGPDYVKVMFPKNVNHKPDVKYIDGTLIHFLDGSSVEVEAIIYCSGFKYGFPFLDDNCGIKVDDNYVHPLYKQFISIPHNSMFFMGLPHHSFLFQLFELQAKIAVNILTGKAQLASKDEMEADTLRWEEALAAKGTPKRRYHCIRESVKEYFYQLAEVGNVEPCPDILFEIFHEWNSMRKELATYRNRVITIIDSRTFRVD